MYLHPSEGGLLASCEEVGWFGHCRFVSAFGVCISSGCDSCGPWVTPGCRALLRGEKGKREELWVVLTRSCAPRFLINPGSLWGRGNFFRNVRSQTAQQSPFSFAPRACL